MTFSTVEILVAVTALVAIVTPMVIAALIDVMECHRADGLVRIALREESCGTTSCNYIV